MAKLIYSMITSLDGYAEAAEGDLGTGAADDQEVHTFVNDLFRPVGTYLYGRRMYETMVYWETAHAEPDRPPHCRLTRGCSPASAAPRTCGRARADGLHVVRRWSRPAPDDVNSTAQRHPAWTCRDQRKWMSTRRRPALPDRQSGWRPTSSKEAAATISLLRAHWASYDAHARPGVRPFASREPDAHHRTSFRPGCSRRRRRVRRR
ncbi:hypothetical protein [Streptomyces antarcticus]|uniref:hypothetical protein n=1 Tax=Streptomyces antarcticus TaxID=2996458 RepID=UPI002D1E3721|nr:hypothetical protein [Streptomyces sp. H34-AA3]